MDLEKSRDGFYTLTFVNKYNLTLSKIKKEFNTVGRANITNYLNQRYFIKYLQKDAAEKAILKYGSIYDVKPAINSSTKKGTFEESQSKEKVFHTLILGNLPKNYTVEQVKFLIEEVAFDSITKMEETKCLKLKFCLITLCSDNDLKYLIKKLDKFVLCGEKLIAIDEKDLLSYHQMFNEKLNMIDPSPES